MYTEVFSLDSKTAHFNRAVNRVKDDTRCTELLGASKKITAYGEPTWNKWARARPIAYGHFNRPCECILIYYVQVNYPKRSIWRWTSHYAFQCKSSSVDPQKPIVIRCRWKDPWTREWSTYIWSNDLPTANSSTSIWHWMWKVALGSIWKMQMRPWTVPQRARQSFSAWTGDSLQNSDPS